MLWGSRPTRGPSAHEFALWWNIGLNAICNNTDVVDLVASNMFKSYAPQKAEGSWCNTKRFYQLFRTILTSVTTVAMYPEWGSNSQPSGHFIVSLP